MPYLLYHAHCMTQTLFMYVVLVNNKTLITQQVFFVTSIQKIPLSFSFNHCFTVVPILLQDLHLWPPRCCFICYKPEATHGRQKWITIDKQQWNNNTKNRVLTSWTWDINIILRFQSSLRLQKNNLQHRMTSYPYKNSTNHYNMHDL